MTEERQILVTKFEVIRPIGDGNTWETVGPRLRDLRGAMHRCLNSGIVECAVRDAQGDPPKAWSTAALVGVKAQVDRDRAWAQQKLAKPGARGDASVLDRIATFALPGVVSDAVSRKAGQSYQDFRKHAWRGDKSLPSFKGGAPIFVRDGGWSIAHDGKGYVIDVKLTAGRTGSIPFAVGPCGPKDHAEARHMVTLVDGAKLCDAKLVWSERKRKWFINATWSRPKPAPGELSPSRVLAVHRGISAFLTAACGEPGAAVVRTLADGQDILAFKGQMLRRRSAIQAHKRELGGGAHGHGVARKHEVYTSLEDKEARVFSLRRMPEGKQI